jgi:DNA-binding HxlR family transcriptional regulator
MPDTVDHSIPHRKFEIRTSGAGSSRGSLRPVEGYGQFCPIALGSEVFAERWTPIILRNLMVGCDRFGEILAGAPGLPRSVLSARLRRLERDGVVERSLVAGTPCYRLTACGAELAQVCVALGIWGARWREVRPEHLDPYLALWTLSTLVSPDALPQPRVVVRFDVHPHPAPNRYWLVVAPSEREVCVHDPGFGDDAVVATDPATLVSWISGRLSLGHAQQANTMSVTGPPWSVRMLAAWGTLSPFASITPAHAPG